MNLDQDLLNFRVVDTLHKLVNQGENVLIPMIEPEGNFTQINMKEFSGYSTVRIEPMFSITPEALNAVYMTASLGPSSLFSDHDMVASYGKGTVGMPVVSVVEAPGFRVLFDESGHLGAAPSLNREDTNLAVSLEDAEHNDFACGTPTAFALPAPAKRGLVALHGTLEGLSALFLEGQCRPCQTKESFDGRKRGVNPEAHPVNRDAQNEQLKQSPLRSLRKPAGIPHGNPAVTFTTTAALESAVSKVPRPFATASRTTPHGQTILRDLVRFR